MLSGLHYSEEVYRHLRFLETIIDSLAEGVAVGHKSEGLVLFNTAARDILGLTITKVPPEKWSEYYGIYYADGKRLMPWQELPMIQALEGKTIRGMDLFIKNPEIQKGCMISLDAYPVSDVLGVVVFRDVTQERIREQALEEAKEAAEIANRAKTQFLANISHEIRTPVGIVLGFSRMLSDSTQLSGENAAWLSIVQRNAEHLSSLVDGILDLSKIESGQLRFEHKAFSFSFFLQDTLDPLQRQALEKGLKFSIEFEKNLPDRLYTDETAIRRVFINIVGNAIKFTEKGEIQIVVRSAGEGLKVEIRDSGIGIDNGFLDQLFKPFSQADSSMARRYGGTGLGLIVSKHLMEALGGGLRLEKSHLGKGSTFVIELSPKLFQLPEGKGVASDLSNGLNPKNDRIAIFETKPLEGVKILIVEDNQDNQLLINHLLKRAGAEVLVASDGEQGVEMATEKEVDMIIMDIQMPGLDGYQATSLLRRKGFNKPIIALTAHALRQEHQKCLMAGCNDYLSKPVNPFQLISVLKGSIHTDETCLATQVKNA